MKLVDIGGIGVIPAQAGRTLGPSFRLRGKWGHPRAGGADSARSHRCPRVRGSSPRRRGGPRTCCGGGGSSRGHPRAGGADCPDGDRVRAGRGSSPRRRGGRWRREHNRRGRGVIPAQAGRTLRRDTTSAVGRGHPRAGGADLQGGQLFGGVQGSSPRRRGGRRREADDDHRLGVIPAQAGRTRAGVRVPGKTRGHPRAGGADSTGPVMHSYLYGSSPRRRGGRLGCDDRNGLPGVIPAQAGRTPRLVGVKLPTRGHPRAGGADCRSLLRPVVRWGSSPRRRGGLGQEWGTGRLVGVIPAQAGRTFMVTAPSRTCGGHPRAGGADPDG